METPFTATPEQTKQLIAMGILVRSSSIPGNGKRALITKDIHGRICVGGIGHYGNQYPKMKDIKITQS